MTGLTFFGLPLKPEIEIGNLLTFITLLAGFLWWFYTTFRTWRRSLRDDARGGALRLLLALLRERKGFPIALPALHDRFSSPEQTARRKAYCRCNYKFESADRFEAAIYRLAWEGKIDFVGADEIVFRIDRQAEKEDARRRLNPSQGDRSDVLRILKNGLEDKDARLWELKDVAYAAFALQPEETVEALRMGLHHDQGSVQRVAAALLGELLPRA